MDHWTQFLGEHGAGVLFAIAFANQMGVPLPAEIFFLQAGALVAEGKLGLGEALVPAILGTLLANLVLYETGRRSGVQLLESISRYSLEPQSLGSETKRRFGRWGQKFLLVSQFFPLAWTLPILSGMARASVARFFALSGLGAALWIGTFLAAGFLGSHEIDRLLSAATRLTGTVGSLLAILIAGSLIRKLVRRRRILRLHHRARISPEHLKTKVDAGERPVILDVRTREGMTEFPFVIPGSLVIPAEEIDSRRREIPGDRELVVYCSCANELMSARVALKLNREGIERIHALEGGIDAWKAHGFPVEPHRTELAHA